MNASGPVDAFPQETPLKQLQSVAEALPMGILGGSLEPRFRLLGCV